MAECKHTPGPWSTFADDLTVIAGGTVVGKFHPEAPNRANVNGTHTDEAKANARLATAAPDLLDALRKLMTINDDHGPFGGEMYQDRIDRAWDGARAAVAKAEGRSHD